MSERRYDTPPKNRASLEQRLRNLIDDDALQLRARRQIGYIAALGTHARDEDIQPVFAIKGGRRGAAARPAGPRDQGEDDGFAWPHRDGPQPSGTV